MSTGPSAWEAWHRGEPCWGIWNAVNEAWEEDCFGNEHLYSDKARADDLVAKFSSVAYPIEVRSYPPKSAAYESLRASLETPK